MTRTFLHLVLRFASIGVVILFIALAGYVIYDPFKVLRERPDYSNDPPDVVANRDHISTVVFLRNNEKEQYDSFIFGSSRALAFRPSRWVQYLDTSASPFLFNASGETVHGITQKVKYLDSTGVRINNALIILCRDFSFKDSEHHQGPLFVKHPAVSGGGWLQYHWTFAKAYLDPGFLRSFYTYRLTGHYQPWMENVLANYKITYDTHTNETAIVSKESEIIADPEAFYAAREHIFTKRVPNTAEENIITAMNQRDLISIARIFKEQGTRYHVVISPLYEQRTLSGTDRRILRTIFGDALSDHSGVNHFTADVRNYYETSHYRPHIGDSIMELIYH